MKKRSIKESLQKRTEESRKTKDSAGVSGSNFLDVSSITEENIFYALKKGKNVLDIIPFEAKTNTSPRVSEGEIDYLLDLWVHRYIGPKKDSFVCLQKNYGKACPLCEYIKEMRDQGADEKEYKELYAKRRVVYNVIDLLADEPRIQLFEVAHFNFEKELLEYTADSAEDGEIITIPDLADGRSIEFKGVENTFAGKTFIEIKRIKLVEREEYEDEIIDDAYSLDELIVIPNYTEMKNSFYGNDEEEESEDTEDETEEAEEKPRKKKLKKKEVEETKCPNGYVFGDDCDKEEHADDCDNCDIWDDCSEAIVSEDE